MPLEALSHPLTPAGLHYTLIHYDIPVVDPRTWRLTVRPTAAAESTLTLDEIVSRPARTVAVTMECAGNGRAGMRPRAISQPWIVEAVGTAEWTGAPLWPLLAEAGLDEAATEIVFTGLDRGVEGSAAQFYQRSLSLDVVRGSEEILLAYEMNGRPLLPQHGYPLRLVVPGWYGMTNVKWLHSIDAVAEPFRGYQNIVAYRVRAEEGEPGEPVSRIAPRSLLVPPGVPDFMTRRRHLEPGSVQIRGRAWSGHGEIVTVEVSADGGRSWSPARLTEPVGPHAWRGWSWSWDAQPGEQVLCCRATDATGRTQPLSPPWNLGGYANNAVHRVEVSVGPLPG
ncbi:MAG: sulfite oxidase [Solirubrobacterales bacterium]